MVCKIRSWILHAILFIFKSSVSSKIVLFESLERKGFHVHDFIVHASTSLSHKKSTSCRWSHGKLTLGLANFVYLRLNAFLDTVGWDVFILKYDVEEPIATVLDNAAMKAYLQIFRLLWALKRAEHSLNDCWVDLNSLQRQLSAFPGYVRQSGLQSYSKPS